MANIKLGFFDPISWPQGKHSCEKKHFIGKLSEWFFDFGQQSFIVDTTNSHQKKVILVKNSSNSSTLQKILKVIGCIFKVCLMPILFLPMLVGKAIYRSSNHFSSNPTNLSANNSGEIKKDQQDIKKTEVKKDIAIYLGAKERREVEIIGGIYSQERLEEYRVMLDNRIDNFRLESYHDFFDLTNLSRDIAYHYSSLTKFVRELSFRPDYIVNEQKCLKLNIFKKFQDKIKDLFLPENSDARQYFKVLEQFLKDTNESTQDLSKEIESYVGAVKLFSVIDRQSSFYDKKFFDNLIRKLRPKGIANAGNSCYIGSALQVFSSIPHYSNKLIENEHFKEFYDSYTKTQNAVPASIIAKFRRAAFENKIILEEGITAQHDPLCLVGGLLENVKHFIKTIDYNVEDLGEGLQKKEEDAGIISICMKESEEKGAYCHSFQGLVDNQFSPSEERNRLTKLTEAPEYLPVQLLRFSNSAKKYNEEVIFNYGETVNFKNAIYNNEMDQDYVLEAVMYHEGNSLDGGHIVADVKKAGRWYHCNDSSVKEIGLVNQRIGNGYIFIFKKKG